MTIVYLGNRNAVEVIDDPDDGAIAHAEDRAVRKTRRPAPGKRCTTVQPPDGMALVDVLYDIVLPGRGIWAAHSDDPAPAWVASTDPALAQVLAAHYDCELRQPEPDHQASETAGEPSETGVSG